MGLEQWLKEKILQTPRGAGGRKTGGGSKTNWEAHGEINMHQKVNFSKCRFRINPIIERGKSMQAKDEMMRLNIINPNRVRGKTYNADEVVSMLAFFEPLVPIWIDVKLYRYTEEVAEFQLDCSVRLRKPSLLRNQESGHPPFRAVM